MFWRASLWSGSHSTTQRNSRRLEIHCSEPYRVSTIKYLMRKKYTIESEPGLNKQKNKLF